MITADCRGHERSKGKGAEGDGDAFVFGDDLPYQRIHLAVGAGVGLDLLAQPGRATRSRMGTVVFVKEGQLMLTT
jgi:hypothetical protein